MREGSEGEVNVVREREREKREVAAAVSQPSISLKGKHNISCKIIHL